MKNLFLILLFLTTQVFAGTEAILKVDQADGLESVKNYMKEKAHFEKNVNGWVAYADAAGTRPVDGTGGAPAITCTRSTTTPITGDGSLIVTKDAVNRQGQGCSATFTVDNAAKTRVMQIELDYRVVSGTFVAGSDTTDSDLILYMYDVTNSTLIEPSSIKFLSNSTTNPSKMIANFQTSATGTTYNLILHASTTSAAAYVVMFDNVKVMQSRYVYGTPITDWAAYTPSNTQGLGTIASVNLKWRRVGDTMQIQGSFTTGTVTASTAQLGLPSGATIGGTASTRAYAGETIRNGGSRITNFAIQGVTYLTFGGGASSHGDLPGNSAFGSTEALYITAFDIPISGWSSSVQVSDGYDGRLISFTGTQSSEAVTANVTNITFTSTKDSTNSWSTNTFTIPSAGDYVVSANAVSTSVGSLAVYRSGTLYGYFVAAPSAGLLSGGSILVSNCTAGQTLTLRFGNAATITSGNISIYKLQAPTTISATEVVGALYAGLPTGTLANALNAITFGTKVSDTHNAYSGSTYTVSQSGFYSVSAQSTQSATYTAGSAAVTAIAINGTSTYTAIESAGFAGTYTLSPTINVKMIPLRAGDTVVIQSLNNGTSPSFTNPLTGANWFSIVREK